MAVHNFGPIYHSEAPKSMKMTGWVDDDGNYSITFASAFIDADSSFKYSWTIYVGTDSSNPVIEIPQDTINNDASFTKTATGKISGTKFHAWAHCGCDGCANNTAPLIIADINLYVPPTLGTIEVINRTTKSITVKATWNDVNGEEYTKANATIKLVKSDGTVVATKTEHSKDGSDPVTFDNLDHNTAYTVKASLSDGTTTLNYTDITTSTKLLKVEYSNLEIHQYSAIVNFISSIDNKKEYDQINIVRQKCNLTSAGTTYNDNISFEDDKTKPANSKVIIHDLKSYTKYKLEYYITDGHNIVSVALDFTTVFPYARININGESKKVIPYIYANKEWHIAKGYIGNKEFNGE